jgi:hypothetical protein
MRKSLAAFVALVALLNVTTPAFAALAYLERCDTGTSVTGRFIYIGTYNYAGHRFTATFTNYCPQTIDVQ